MLKPVEIFSTGFFVGCALNICCEYVNLLKLCAVDLDTFSARIYPLIPKKCLQFQSFL
jgi:hypothetical protein